MATCSNHQFMTADMSTGAMVTVFLGNYYPPPSLSPPLPQKPASPEVQISLREVHLAAKRLQAQCQESGRSDLAFHTRHIMNSAYDVAKRPDT